MITCFSFLFNLVANYQLILGELGFAAVLFFISFIMDCADGQLARHRSIVSRLGMYMDIILDGFKDIITFIALIVYFAQGSLFYYSLFSMFIISSSILIDWVRKTMLNVVKEEKPLKSGVLSKYGIVFWSGPIRNLLIVFCLILYVPEGIIYYSCLFGSYCTYKKGIDLIRQLQIIGG